MTDLPYFPSIMPPRSSDVPDTYTSRLLGVWADAPYVASYHGNGPTLTVHKAAPTGERGGRWVVLNGGGGRLTDNSGYDLRFRTKWQAMEAAERYRLARHAHHLADRALPLMEPDTLAACWAARADGTGTARRPPAFDELCDATVAVCGAMYHLSDNVGLTIVREILTARFDQALDASRAAYLLQWMMTAVERFFDDLPDILFPGDIVAELKEALATEVGRGAHT